MEDGNVAHPSINTDFMPMCINCESKYKIGVIRGGWAVKNWEIGGMASMESPLGYTG